MQVILLETMNKLGSAGEVVSVKDGYGRNFLIPKKKAIAANKKNREELQSKMDQINANNEKKIKEAESIVSKLKEFEVSIEIEANEEGSLYGTISPKQIIDKINEKLSLDLSAENLIYNSIKNIGVHPISVRLYNNIQTQISLEVVKKN
tara:strand:- start:470 stop:916 length:447 start_codon:yes stop_codon:yes gene_type:complete